MVLVHGGGWAGHSERGQRVLMGAPGQLLLERGWRIVSVDMDEGAAGIDGVLSAVGSELAKPAGDGPLCIYGESAGAHLALVAASRRPAVDCVIGLGTLVDMAQLEADGDTSSDANVQILGERIKRFFGTSAEQLAPWNPVGLAPAIRADVLLVHEIDDPLVPAVHAVRYQEAQPTTQVVELEPGDPADPATKFHHGTASALGRAHYAAALGAFADQAIARKGAEHLAAGIGCTGATDHLTDVGLRRVQRALRCLAAPRCRASGRRRGQPAAHDGQPAGRGRRSTDLGSDARNGRGRRSLAALAARHARLSVQVGARSRVSLRCTAGASADQRRRSPSARRSKNPVGPAPGDDLRHARAPAVELRGPVIAAVRGHLGHERVETLQRPRRGRRRPQHEPALRAVVLVARAALELVVRRGAQEAHERADLVLAGGGVLEVQLQRRLLVDASRLQRLPRLRVDVQVPLQQSFVAVRLHVGDASLEGRDPRLRPGGHERDVRGSMWCPPPCSWYSTARPPASSRARASRANSTEITGSRLPWVMKTGSPARPSSSGSQPLDRRDEAAHREDPGGGGPLGPEARSRTT